MSARPRRFLKHVAACSDRGSSPAFNTPNSAPSLLRTTGGAMDVTQLRSELRKVGSGDCITGKSPSDSGQLSTRPLTAQV